jgi:hypothetical protein
MALIRGTKKADTLRGTRSSDSLEEAFDGNDRLHGGGGRDDL